MELLSQAEVINNKLLSCLELYQLVWQHPAAAWRRVAARPGPWLGGLAKRRGTLPSLNPAVPKP